MPDAENAQKQQAAPDALAFSLDDNIVQLRTLFDNSADLVVHRMTVGGQQIAIVACEGMVNLQAAAAALFPMLSGVERNLPSPAALRDLLREALCLSLEQNELRTLGELCTYIMSGFVVIVIDGVDSGFSMGLQGFNFRSISEPSSENNVRGSREGFVEVLRINMTMVRRRIKSPSLTFELMKAGKKSNTDICLCYLHDMVSRDILRQIKTRIGKIPLDLVLESGFIQPFLQRRGFSLFPTVGNTERPDTVCAKINEGRVAILVDGTPYALIAPYLFIENFQNFDDYCQSPWYVSLTRLLRFFAFAFTILLPGLYVAAVSFHPDLIPQALLYNVVGADSSTPFPILLEALVIHLVYELMMEAGLRLPRPIGHAMSIVGALVIGDAIVKAGLVTSTMVTVVALTAVSSFVVPSLYNAITMLRFVFILLGGLLGLHGIILGVFLLLVLVCRADSFGIPYTAPLSPFRPQDMRDVFVRSSWRKLGRRTVNVDDMSKQR